MDLSAAAFVIWTPYSSTAVVPAIIFISSYHVVLLRASGIIFIWVVYRIGFSVNRQLLQPKTLTSLQRWTAIFSNFIHQVCCPDWATTGLYLVSSFVFSNYLSSLGCQLVFTIWWSTSAPRILPFQHHLTSTLHFPLATSPPLVHYYLHFLSHIFTANFLLYSSRCRWISNSTKSLLEGKLHQHHLSNASLLLSLYSNT